MRRIGKEELRRRLRPAAPLPREPGWILSDEGVGREEGPGRQGSSSGTPVPAAVLIGLVAYPHGAQLILTERTVHLKDHAGQISLPGGRIEAADGGPVAAALREASEEVGLAPERVEILGELAAYDTITGFRVHPVVGWIEPPITYTPDPFEVASVFEVPLEFVLDAANHQRGSLVVGGQVRSYYVLPYPDRRIWGATAGILVNFARLLSADP